MARQSNNTITEGRARPPSAIEAREIGFTYPDGTDAISDVTVTVPKGEFFGFLGPNGAGKTTTIKTLVTLLRPTTGRVSVNGHDVTTEPRRIRASIGYTAQETSIDPDLTARENLVLACEAYHVPKECRAARIEDLLSLVDLEEVADKRAETFSGGMQKRLDVATSLVHDPPLVFLDEPTTGLDPRGRLELWEYFREINEQGTTIFLTTQYLEEADQLCSCLAVIADGEIVATGSPRELKDAVGGDRLELEIESAAGGTLDRVRQTVEQSGLLAASDAVGITEDGIVVTSSRAQELATDLLVAMRDAGHTVTGFTVRSPTLDDVFLHFTGGTLSESRQFGAISTERELDAELEIEGEQ